MNAPSETLQEWACRSRELGSVQEALGVWGGYQVIPQEPVVGLKEFPTFLNGISTAIQ